MDPARELDACTFLPPDLDADTLCEILVSRTDTDPLVCEALAIARDAHRLHTRDEGAPYIVHPARVALSLVATGQPPHVIAAGLCHDVFEDAPGHAHRVVALGREVADLVEALTDDWYEDYYAKILGAGTEACRIKIADRIDNLRFLHFTTPGKQTRYVRETAAHFPELVEHASSPQLAGALIALLEWHLIREASARAAAQSTRGDVHGP
ncbi:MAG: bifunctional (p)ppGpp synthetase/guanosine-3',5'-bis(diphosphate) 3'-pyrophosphohydrolase [Acidimicrobiia bacterium]|nr:bifunctional (p)ppGpp synthetase/guanosine-3',5'-bis(diphosphate) 3'-pyrophosphohydrolase [Acidimicrobiia bacterium]